MPSRKPDVTTFHRGETARQVALFDVAGRFAYVCT